MATFVTNFTTLVNGIIGTITAEGGWLQLIEDSAPLLMMVIAVPVTYIGVKLIKRLFRI